MIKYVSHGEGLGYFNKWNMEPLEGFMHGND